jgi:hypothetical protein
MKRQLLALMICLVILSCGGKGNNPQPGGGGGTGGGGTTTPPAPAQASLVSPAQNAVCTTGTIVTDSTSAITFSWDASSNTSSYQVSIQNLLTNAVITQTSAQTKVTVTLLRNTPYAWFVVSSSTKTTTTTQSTTWKFYNAGTGTVSYAPFPADIVSPTFGQVVTPSGGAVSLSWQGSDVLAGSIASYDVYFGTAKTPPLLQSNITATTISNLPVSENTTYYWEVITKDNLGNTSSSGIYQFTVN